MEPRDASVQINCTTDIDSNHLKMFNVAYEIFMRRYRHACGSNVNTSGLHLPEALYSGVLHDRARSEAKGIHRWVSGWDGRSPFILLLLGVLSTHPLSTESLNARLYLTDRQRDSM